jgi:formamidopyrimidine-DNA glycosylase
MPELPEVETTLRGVEPHLLGRSVREVIVREHRLRRPVSPSLDGVTGARITAVDRRAKYLIVRLAGSRGHLLIHLGMSGSLRISGPAEEFRTHDHVALTLSSGRQLRYHDPRRFGIFLHLPHGAPPLDHPLLSGLGPEPLGSSFTPDQLAASCRGRRAAIKLVIMDPKVVVGVGNIYASEALFRAGIRPGTAARRLSRPKLLLLHQAIREVLAEAIRQGGTTLRDFLGATGEPGYFRQQLRVYDRRGKACHACGSPIRHRLLGQRSTYWCPSCQR